MEKCKECKRHVPLGTKFCTGCGTVVASRFSDAISYKIVVMGTGGVGKSSLTLRYVHNTFCTAYDPTIEDLYINYISRGKTRVKVELLDTAGQEAFSSLRELYIAEGDAFVLVYSISSRESYKRIENFADAIHRGRTDNPPIVLVGNKCDLVLTRCVTLEEGSWTAKIHSIYFTEASAKENINIGLVFDVLVDTLLQRDGVQSPTKKRGCIIL